MGFWLFMLAMDLLIPGTMIGCGAHYSKNTPKEINRLSGYRTPRSMASREAWDFAHRLFGTIWLWCGVVLLPLSAVAFIPLLGASEGTVGLWGTVLCGAQVLVMIATIPPVELALNARFDRNGQPKPLKNKKNS